MAAISAKRHNPRGSVLLLDRTFALGRKILVSGAGRCNITNHNLERGPADHYYGASPEFISTVFEKFNYQRIVEFFQDDLGIELYTERKTNIGKVFPITNQAKTVTMLLENELLHAGVTLTNNTEVVSLRKLQQNGDFRINYKDSEQRSGRVVCRKVIIATGGKTYPALGSNGSGYELARSLGHSVVDPVPSALPLESKNPLSHALQGVELEVAATSLIGAKRVKTRVDEVMFTQYGLSGPAILNISREISIRLNREHKSDVEIELNFFPTLEKEQIFELLTARWARKPEQTVEMSLIGLFPAKVPAALLTVANIDRNRRSSQLKESEIARLVNVLYGYRVEVTATRGWNEAEFTAGGVDTREVSAATLESKLVPGLYFAGEVLDVDGDVGGFNLSWAWSSGYVAGAS
jgi:predicted Rossmann fold flavoprotein